MASWGDLEAEHPDFAQAVRRVFEVQKHKVLATLRADGAPRVSGNEATFSNGQLWLGMMAGSRKAIDLRNDPRMAIHSATVDEKMTDGDAKIAGRAVESTDPSDWTSVLPDESPPENSHLFRIDIDEVVLTRVGEPADHLVIEVWKPGKGISRIERR
jgi:hypothetical protein